MLCPKCSHVSQPGSHICSACGAKLILSASGTPPTESKGKAVSPLLAELAWSIHRFVKEDGELEDIVERKEDYKELLDEFWLEYESANPDDELEALADAAELAFVEGCKLFDDYFEAEEEFEQDWELLYQATKHWLACNDQLVKIVKTLQRQDERELSELLSQRLG